MPIDKHLAAVLQKLAAAGRKPAHEVSLQESRAGYLALTHGSLTPDQIVPVASVEHTVISGGAVALEARIYRPEGTGPFPTTVFFHGGGFVIGDIDTHDNMCRDLCRGSEVVVVSVGYRLAPEHPFPAAVDDAIEATKWVAAHARELGGTDTVAVAGDSAGGNLAAVVAQQLSAQGLPLAAQFLIYPPVDHMEAKYLSRDINGKGYFLELETLRWFSTQYANALNDVTDPRLTPIRANNFANLPPALIVTAEFDPLRDEGEAYGKALVMSGVYAEVILCDGMIHTFFDMGRWSPAAQDFIQKCLRRFGQLVRGS